MFPGETVHTGADKVWEGVPVDGPKVMESAAGFYIGYSCTEYGQEGFPYTRESVRYWRTPTEAQEALDSDEWERRS